MRQSYWPILAALIFVSSSVYAQVTIDLSPAMTQGSPGDVLTFTGSLTNLGTYEVFLNGDTANLTGSGLSLDDTTFLTNGPLSLVPRESWTGEMFKVSVSSLSPLGQQGGTFTILGGLDSSAQNDLATANFTIGVSPKAVPEPNAFLITACGVLVFGMQVVRLRHTKMGKLRRT